MMAVSPGAFRSQYFSPQMQPACNCIIFYSFEEAESSCTTPRRQASHTIKAQGMKAKRKKELSESTTPLCLQLKHLQRQRFVFWGSPGFFTIPFKALRLPSGVILCTPKISADFCQLSNTLWHVVDRW